MTNRLATKRFTLLSFVFILTIFTGYASADASVHLYPEMVTGLTSGTAFDVEVKVDSGEYDLRAVNLQLNYDPAVLQVNRINNNKLFGVDTLEAPGNGDNGAGTVTFGIASTGTYSPASGTLMTINFQVKDNTADGNYRCYINTVALKDKNNNPLPLVKITDSSGTRDQVLSKSTGTGATATTSATSSMPTAASAAARYEYIFGSHPDDYTVITTRGSSQVGHSQVDGSPQGQSLSILENELMKTLGEDYLFPRGKVISLGTNSNGYVVIVFHKPFMVQQAEIDRIYTIADKTARDLGISNVAVEFGSGTSSQVSERVQQTLDRMNTLQKKGLQEMIESNSPMYNPEIIATAGKLPVIKTEKEYGEWFFLDSQMIYIHTMRELEPYFKSGDIVSMDLSADGYFELRLHGRNEDYTRSLINDVYLILDTESGKAGRDYVPAVFLRDTGNMELASAFEQEQQTQQSPGFESIVWFLSIAMLYCCKGLITRRKRL